MGLLKGDAGRLQNRDMAGWLLPIVVIAIAVIVALWGDSGREWLSYDRGAIARGEIWRLLSGHLVHLGPAHLLLNLMGFVLIWILIGRVFNIAQWLAIGAVITLGIDLGFWIFEPQLEWYVGLSGVLHGVLAAGIVASVRAGQIEIVILGVGLIAKLIYEQAAGPLPGSEQTSGGAVIIAAHAYGALAGAVAGGLYRIKERRAT